MHRQEEEALKESEEKYRMLIDNIQEGVFIIQDYKVRFANEAFARLGDYSLEDIIGKDFREFIAPEDLKMVVYRYLQRLAGRKVPREYELRMMHRDGKTRIIVNLNVGVITYFGREAIMGTAKDITDRKRNEKALQEREHFLNNIFSSIQDGISVLDSELNILRVNPAMERWYAGAKPLVGKKCYLAYHGRSEPCEACPGRRTIKTGEAAVEVVPRIGGEHKVTGWLDVYSFPLADNETGEISGVIEYVRDISDIKKAEELQHENQKLAYASRAKSDFLANMSHELRTPLNSIIGFSELMRMNSMLGEKNNHYLENILTSGKYLLNLINDILDLSKVEAGKIELFLEKINVPSIIDESIILIKEKASKHNVLLKKELDPALLFMEADQRRFKQMLFNLLSNAVKFSKTEGGTITITTKKEGDTARISVSDTGIGIKEEDMGRLFNEFEQLDSGISRKYGGTGLGLAITKKLVELHGGKIRVESTYGEGSTFTVFLPLSAKKKGRV